MSNEERFQRALSDAISSVLEELGESVRVAILYHVERISGVSSQDLYKNPALLAISLRKIFAAGSSLIEDKIIQAVCKEMGLRFERSGGTFEQKLECVLQGSGVDRSLLLKLN